MTLLSARTRSPSSLPPPTRLIQEEDIPSFSHRLDWSVSLAHIMGVESVWVVAALFHSQLLARGACEWRVKQKNGCQSAFLPPLHKGRRDLRCLSATLGTSCSTPCAQTEMSLNLHP